LFEGIGGLMPIMSATKDRESFPYLLCGAISFLVMMYIFFGELCYYTFGGNLNKAIIMEMMPADNPIIQVVKILFMLNLVFSYPLTIFITNLILEGFTFRHSKRNTTLRKWLKNFQRSFVLLVGIVCALYLKDSLDKIFALSGTVLGTTVVMSIPAICHLNLLAKTKTEKFIDVLLVLVAMTVMVFCTYRILIS
jgi:proton-coupled amino acid transporter